MRLQNYVTCWGTALDWLEMCQNAKARIRDDQSQPLRTNTKTLFRSSLSISRLWLHFIINVLNWAQQLSFVCYPIYKTDNAGPCLSLPAILSRIWFWPLAISSSFAELLQFRINEFVDCRHITYGNWAIFFSAALILSHHPNWDGDPISICIDNPTSPLYCLATWLGSKNQPNQW